MKEYIFYEDPGHGWLAVPIKELIELGIADKITGYSYTLGGMAYLEEDCDLGVFVLAYKEKYGKLPEFKQKYQEYTSIRNYPNYTKDKVYKEVA